MTIFIGILDGAGDVWGVRVPDVAGCHGGGPTPQAAVADAISALSCMEADFRLPDARTAEEVAADSASRFDLDRECLVALLYVPTRG